MAGIYIHIPFCLQKCSYCNFYSESDISLKDKLINTLLTEIKLRASYLNNETVRTIYFGGGTPTLLLPNEIQQMIDAVFSLFQLSDEIEITLEANPNNLTEEYIKQLSATAINRLSIGIQSFYDNDLQTLGRIHTAKQAKESILLAQKYHFNNLSIDLMYGFPGLTLEKWKYNLNKIKNIQHISCYQLTLEKKSLLYQKIKNGILLSTPEDEIIEQYHYLISFAKKHRFIHYETSNFCQENFESKHNTSYWQDALYLGIGPSAHSYNRESRQWNISDNKAYITFFENLLSSEDYDLKGENVVFEKEILTTDMRFNEYIMTSLRTIWGCSLDYIQQHFGKSYLKHLQQQLSNIQPDFYILSPSSLRLTEKGNLFADYIAASLFV